ncbi:restriction endonuclease [Pseudoxanthomonas sp. 22568]|uniref:restriction endonuclease n=1 Tax=Pseudoxanthomonas sp. 22568 TaxID=3453945 RepID=UPI003F861B6A
MLFWLSGLAVALLTGVAVSVYLWWVRRRKDEIAAGLHALSGLRWREFSRLVLTALERRGMAVVAAGPDETRDPRGIFPLTLRGQRWLLSCKHGSAYRIGAASVEELASSVRLGNAAGGILATEGQLEQEGRIAAQSHNIEVLDGPRLWDELAPLVEPDLREQIVGHAAARAKRHIAIGWLGSVAVGALVATALANSGLGVEDPAAPATPVPAPASSAAPAANPVAVYREPTEAELEEQRMAVSRALSGTPGVVRGVWQTRLTLVVDYQGDETGIWSRICQQVELYPALRTVRVQLNPPAGSKEPVRWRQCKTI